MARTDRSPKPMTAAEKSNFLAAAIKQAEDFVDGELSEKRAEATRLYRGDPFGDEEDGRSQIVMTEVRDVVQAMLPSLLRIFLSSDHAVEYAPRRADAVQQAEQATDYINYIFQVDNNGAKVLWDAFKDALVRKTGVLKWWLDERKEVTEESFTGIDAEQVALLQSDDECEIVELTALENQGVEPVVSETGELVTPPPLYDVRIRRTRTDKRFVVSAVPPEELLISPNARDEETADLIGHREKRLVSDLVAEGYDLEEILEHGSPEPVLEANQEKQARNPALQTRETLAEAKRLDPSMLRVPYYETWTRMDADGDGIAELHRICSIGRNGHILSDEIVSNAPIALLCPDPEPHTAIGYSIADQTRDLQRIKTSIVRNTLDSLANSIHPRTAVVEGQVNMDDVLNTEVGAIIRMRQIGAVQPLAQPFIGREALPILTYLDDIRAQRTGITRASQGLDPDVLQSTTKAAVTATVSAAQERIEMVARLFAETGIRRMFRGLLKLVVENQDRARLVRLRNKWVEVDPRSWDAEMDVVVNVGLGQGDRSEKIATLMMIAGKQEQMLQLLGPDNPLTDMARYRNTLGEILELSGRKDTTRYFKEVTPEAIQQFQQTLAANQTPDPATLLAQAEREKVMADIKIAGDKMQLEKIKAALADDRERDKIETDARLRAAEIVAKYGAQVNMQEIKANIERQRTYIDAAMTIAQAEQALQQAQAAPALEQQA